MCSGQHTDALSGSHVSKNILVRAPCMACSTGGIRFKWLSGLEGERESEIGSRSLRDAAEERTVVCISVTL